MAQHPTEEILNITRKFLGGEIGTPGVVSGQGQVPGGGSRTIPPPQPPVRQFVGPSGRGLPSQAADIAGRRFGGQRGRLQRNQPGAVAPLRGPDVRPTPFLGPPTRTGSLSDRFFNLPSPVNFAQTPQGRSLLQRILQLRGLR